MKVNALELRVSNLVGICPCSNCICVAICRQMPKTYFLLKKCSLAREFYKEAFPYRHYYRFLAIKEALGYRIYSFNNVNLHKGSDWHKDWMDLISHNHMAL